MKITTMAITMTQPQESQGSQARSSWEWFPQKPCLYRIQTPHELLLHSFEISEHKQTSLFCTQIQPNPSSNIFDPPLAIALPSICFTVTPSVFLLLQSIRSYPSSMVLPPLIMVQCKQLDLVQIPFEWPTQIKKVQHQFINIIQQVAFAPLDLKKKSPPFIF